MSDVKPIRTEANYEAALAEVELLWGAKAGTARGDRLDVLATLIDVYESQHYPMDPPDPIDAIKFRMEQQNLTRKDLEPFVGERGRVTEVLNRRRPLTLRMIRNLIEGLALDPSVLTRPYDVRAPRTFRRRAAKSGAATRVS